MDKVATLLSRANQKLFKVGFVAGFLALVWGWLAGDGKKPEVLKLLESVTPLWAAFLTVLLMSGAWFVADRYRVDVSTKALGIENQTLRATIKRLKVLLQTAKHKTDVSDNDQRRAMTELEQRRYYSTRARDLRRRLETISTKGAPDEDSVNALLQGALTYLQQANPCVVALLVMHAERARSLPRKQRDWRGVECIWRAPSRASTTVGTQKGSFDVTLSDGHVVVLEVILSRGDLSVADHDFCEDFAQMLVSLRLPERADENTGAASRRGAR